MDVSSKLTWAFILGCAGFIGMGRIFAEPPPADANPYSVISDANIFHLNPPPPPPKTEEKPPDVPTVKLTGFIGKGDHKKVMFAVLYKDPKTPTKYLTLSQGEKEADVELLRFDISKEEAQINNSGTLQILTAKSNSFAPTMAVAPHPSGAPQGGGSMPPPDARGIHHPPGTPVPFPALSPQSSAARSSPSASSMESGSMGSGSTAPIIAGSGGYGGSQYNASGSGAIISAGGAVSPGSPINGNGSVAARLANAFANPIVGGSQRPAVTGAPSSPATQWLAMKATEMNGGPPAPPPPPDDDE
jgi:hypothetical protein